MSTDRPRDLGPPDDEGLRREVLAEPPGMIREGWSFWFTHTGWKLLVPVAFAAGIVAAWLLR